MPIPSQKSLFSIPEDVTYLNCAYMGPQLQESSRIGHSAIERKAFPWQVTPQDFFTESEEVRSLCAELIGASADDIALIPSSSYGAATAATNISIKSRQKIIVLEEQFPSNIYAWRELAHKSGAEIITVARPKDLDWTSAVLKAISPDTALLALPQCHWTDGGYLDLVAIGETARKVGAALVIDGTQSIGAQTFDVKAIKPDFVFCSGYKWLLGPYSTAFLYAAPEWAAKASPLEQNWITREGSEDFSSLVRYRDAYQKGARRFDMGERSNFVLLPMLISSLRQLLSWKVANIAETIGLLTDQIEKNAENLALKFAPKKFRGSHMIGIQLPSSSPQDIAIKLAAQKVYVSLRGSTLRISPHLYNSSEDIDRLFDTVKKILF